MNEQSVKQIDVQRLFKMILWLEDNNQGQIVDWGCVTQILMMIVKEEDLRRRIKDIDKECFWILGIDDIDNSQYY